MLDHVVSYGLLAVTVVLWGIMMAKLLRGLHRHRYNEIMTEASIIEDKPSVSVCIPARNEVHAMVDCLERVIANSYPKLEIIVLDDHSADETPNLIKSFASAGVRFVEGAALPEGWVGKNYSLERLAKEASGTYILFMDVDTHLSVDSIEMLVEYMTHQKVDMVSVLPRRNDGYRLSVLFSTLRYFWEVIFHSKKTPSSSSNAWMIRRDVLLQEYGGFQQLKTAVQPETVVAAGLMARDSYRFLVSSPQMGVAYEKKWRSQISTSVRLLYPLAGAKFFKGVVAALALLFLSVPSLLCLQGLVLGWSTVHLVAAAVLVLFSGLYGIYTNHVWRRGWVIGAVLWPLIIVQELIVFIVSMERHLRGAVTWRGRPIAVSKRSGPPAT